MNKKIMNDRISIHWKVMNEARDNVLLFYKN